MNKTLLATTTVAVLFSAAYAANVDKRAPVAGSRTASNAAALAQSAKPAQAQARSSDTGDRATFTGPLPSRRTCTVIGSLPYTITSPGHYCYAADLVSSSFYGVRIEASDVSLDCRGFSTRTSLPRSGGSDGIYAVAGSRNATIRNCRVIDFDRGITASFSSMGVRILDNRVDGAQSVGIGAWGDGAQVIGNRVTNTHPAEPGQYSNGISLLPTAPETASKGQVLAHNVVVNVYGSAQTTGIIVSGSTAPLIQGNSVMELRPTTGGLAIGLWLNDWAQGARTTAANVMDNQLMGRAPGYSDFATQTVESVASCTRNVTVGVAASNLSFCPSGSGNVVVP